MTPQASRIESQIVNDFFGLIEGNRYELSNGQVWEQTDQHLWAWVWVRPKVVITEEEGAFKMQVERIDQSVRVRRIA